MMSSAPDGFISQALASGRGWGWRQADKVDVVFDRNGIAILAQKDNQDGGHSMGVILADDSDPDDLQSGKLVSFFEVAVSNQANLPNALSQLQGVAQRLLVLKQGGWNINEAEREISSVSQINGERAVQFPWKNADNLSYEDGGQELLQSVKQQIDNLPKRADDWRGSLDKAIERVQAEAREEDAHVWGEMAEARFGDLDEDERQQIGNKASELRQKYGRLSDEEVLDRAREQLISARAPSTERLRSWLGQGSEAS